MRSAAFDWHPWIPPPHSPRVLKKNPELIEEFIDRAASLLHDKNQAVALAGVTLMLAITALEPAAVERYRAHVPTLCKMLRGLLQVRFGG
jgi:AP-1 complex subunit gamma-1